MAVLLHAGALAVMVIGTCCVAASGRRLRVREALLALIMLAAMTDVVLAASVLAPVWWAGVLLLAALLSVVAAPGSRARPADRRARAMDALGAVLMAGLFAIMSGDTGAAAADGHHGHGGSSSALLWGFVAASALFAAASAHMGVAMRMPHVSVAARAMRRAAPISMGVSVLLMAAVVVV